MAGETIITIVGNLTADPELRYTQNGLPVANFTIASTPRSFDRQANEWKDDEALFMRCSVWREFAEHVAGSLTKGTRVIATGRLKQRSYQDREGNNRTAIELEIDEIGPSLRYATAQVTRAAGGQGQQGGQQQYGAPQQQQYGQPQGQPPQQYGPPQGAPQQYGPPQGQPPQQQPPAQQPQQQPPAQQPPAQQPQAPWSTPHQGWAAPGAYGDDTPF
jgi:single-strand DNA-binding protein